MVFAMSALQMFGPSGWEFLFSMIAVWLMFVLVVAGAIYAIVASLDSRGRKEDQSAAHTGKAASGSEQDATPPS